VPTVPADEPSALPWPAPASGPAAGLGSAAEPGAGMGLVRLPAGGWRLYLSCATTGTKHWRVEATDAAHPAELDVRRRSVVLPGDPHKRAVKDPVIACHDGRWHLWACIHPLADPGATDQMTTEYATSADGLDWTWQGVALTGRAGEWDSRGTRVTAVRFGGAGRRVVIREGDQSDAGVRQHIDDAPGGELAVAVVAVEMEVAPHRQRRFAATNPRTPSTGRALSTRSFVMPALRAVPTP